MSAAPKATATDKKRDEKTRSGKEARRRAIINAAKKIFAEKGFHSTNVSDIVKQVGIAQGTFYLYFDDKRHVFSVLMDEMLGASVKLFTVKEPQSEFRTVEDIERSIERMSRPMIKFFDENRDLVKIFFREAQGSALGFDEKIDQFYDRLMRLASVYFEVARTKGLIHSDVNPEIAATMMMGGIEKLLYRWATGRLNLTSEELIHESSRFGLHALFRTRGLSGPAKS